MNNGFYDLEMSARQERLARTPDMARQRDALIRSLTPTRGEAILELGSGNGILARDLVGLVGSEGRVVGIDTSDFIISMARYICPEAEFLLADAQELPFEDASYDKVVAAQVFCFMQDVDKALGEVFRVLKPGGRLVLLDTDWDSLVWRNREPDLMRRVMEAYTGVYTDPYLPRSLRQRMFDIGFTDIGMDSLVILNTDFGEDTYAGQTANFAIPIIEKSPSFTADEMDRWLKDQEDLATSGGFFFSLNRYIAVATKPG